MRRVGRPSQPGAFLGSRVCRACRTSSSETSSCVRIWLGSVTGSVLTTGGSPADTDSEDCLTKNELSSSAFSWSSSTMRPDCSSRLGTAEFLLLKNTPRNWWRRGRLRGWSAVLSGIELLGPVLWWSSGPRARTKSDFAFRTIDVTLLRCSLNLLQAWGDGLFL